MGSSGTYGWRYKIDRSFKKRNTNNLSFRFALLRIEQIGKIFSMKNLLSTIFIISCSALLLFSSCQKELSHETGPGLDSAKGTLTDSSDNCLPDSVHGTYYDGITPRSDTCFVEVQVNVTQTGSYNISTDLQNGFQFIDSGFFNATGINVIRLKPIGTPILPITTIFSVSFDSSICSFFVDVKDSTGTGLGNGDTTGNGGYGGDTTQATLGMWKLYDSSNARQYIGAAAVIDTLISGVPVLIIEGAVATLDTILTIQLSVPDTALSNSVPGVFPTGLSNSFKLSYLNGSTLTDLYVADAGTAAVMTIYLNQYDPVTRVLSGKFSGTANDVAGGGNITITNGSFTVGVP